MTRKRSILGAAASLPAKKTAAIVLLLLSFGVLSLFFTAPVVLIPFVVSLPDPERFVKGWTRFALSLALSLVFDFLFSLSMPAYFLASLISGSIWRTLLPIVNMKHPGFPLFAGIMTALSAEMVAATLALLGIATWRLTPPDVFLYAALPYGIWGLARLGGFAPRDEFPVSL